MELKKLLNLFKVVGARVQLLDEHEKLGRDLGLGLLLGVHVPGAAEKDVEERPNSSIPRYLVVTFDRLKKP